MRYSFVADHVQLNVQIQELVDSLVESFLGQKGRFPSLHYRVREFDFYDNQDSAKRLAEWVQNFAQCAGLQAPTCRSTGSSSLRMRPRSSLTGSVVNTFTSVPPEG